MLLLLNLQTISMKMIKKINPARLTNTYFYQRAKINFIIFYIRNTQPISDKILFICFVASPVAFTINGLHYQSTNKAVLGSFHTFHTFHTFTFIWNINYVWCVSHLLLLYLRWCCACHVVYARRHISIRFSVVLNRIVSIRVITLRNSPFIVKLYYVMQCLIVFYTFTYYYHDIYSPYDH